MALSTVYNVITRYHVESRGAMRGMARLEDRLERLERRAERGRRKLRTLGTAIKFAIGGAVAAGVAIAGREMVRLQKNIEEAKIGLAAVFDANNMNSFEGGLERATKLIKDFRVAAAASPGDEFDLLEISRNIMPALAMMNPDDSQITSLSSRVMAAAHASMGGDIQQASMDVQRIMSGSASVGENRLFTQYGRQMKKHLGVSTTEEFNKVAKAAGGTQKVFEAIMGALGGMDKASKAFGESFIGQWSTLMAHVKNALLGTGGGLFGALTDKLKELNTWFDNNQDRVDKFTRKLGKGLAWAFDKVAGAIELAAKNADVLATALTAVAARKAFIFAGDVGAAAATSRAAGFGVEYLSKTRSLGKKVAGAPRKFLGGVKDFGLEMMLGDMSGFGKRAGGGGIISRNRGMGSKIAKGIKSVPGKIAGGARKVAGGIRGGVLGGMSFLHSGGVMSSMKGGLGAVAGGAASGLSSLAATLTTIATVVAPLVVILGMVAGTFMVLRDSTNEMTVFLDNAISQLMVQLNKAAAAFGADDGFVQGVKDFATWLGEGVVGTLGLVTSAIAGVVAGFNWLLTFLSGLGNAFDNLMNQWDGSLTGLRHLDFGKAFSRGFAEAEKDARERDRKAREQERKRRKKKQKERDKKKKDGEKDGEPKNEVTVILQQENKTDANPDRIAFRTLDLLSDYFEGRRETVPQIGQGG